MRNKEIIKLSDSVIDHGVKIQGTPYDRKRRISDKTISRMIKLYNKKISTSDIAKKFNVTWLGVKYNCDPVWRAEYNAKRSGLHTGIDTCDFKNRAAYKRGLLLERKLKLRKVGD